MYILLKKFNTAFNEVIICCAIVGHLILKSVWRQMDASLNY